MNTLTVYQPSAFPTCRTCGRYTLTGLLCDACERKAEITVNRYAMIERQFQERLSWQYFTSSSYEFNRRCARAEQDALRAVEHERTVIAAQRAQRSAASADLCAWWLREGCWLSDSGKAHVSQPALLAFLKQLRKALPTKAATKQLRTWFGKDFPTFDLITLDASAGHLRAYYWTVGGDNLPTYACLAQQLALTVEQSFTAQVHFETLYDLCRVFDPKARLMLQKCYGDAALVLREDARQMSRLRHYFTPPVVLSTIGVSAS